MSRVNYMDEGKAFVNLPFVAPMMPPLGIPVLAAFLAEHGIRTRSYDLNIEFYRYLLKKDNVEEGFIRIKRDFETQYDSTYKEHNEKILSYILLEEYLLENLEMEDKRLSPNEGIRTHKQLWVTSNIIKKALEISTYGLSNLNNSSPMNFQFANHFSCYRDIFLHKSWEKYIQWFHGRIDDICRENQYICFSLCYDNQIFFLLEATNYIREHYENRKIVVGGPVISGILKETTINFGNDFLQKYANLFDYLILGDGEYPLLDLFTDKENNNVYRFPFKLKDAVEKDKRIPPLLPPKFEDLPLDLYLTPTLVFPMLTARHCYWGKCKFCTHSIGYNQYKRYRNDEIKDCLIKIVDKYNVKNFYFVDECMAPETAEYVAEWICNSGIGISWMTDMRFEKKLIDKTFVQKLAAGGCKYIAFGMESANDRVLELMSKGTTRSDIQQIIENCSENNIYITLMFFFGFPTETIEEATETFEFVIKNIDKISGVGMGCFTLMPGSYVYNNYEEFGIFDMKNPGQYKCRFGMNLDEVRNFYEECRKYVGEKYYRGHAFFHRIYYLLDLDLNDKDMYPIGLTSFSEIVKNRKGNETTQRYKIKNSVVCKKIKIQESDKMRDMIALMNVESIKEEIFFSQESFYQKIIGKNIEAQDIKLLWEMGVLENE